MATINQLCKKGRIKKKHKIKLKALEQNPYKRGVCLKIFIMSPRKPNSANRKVARVKLSNKRVISAGIPGIGHQLQEHSTVLVRGGRCNDLPGVRYKLVRGKLDFNTYESIDRGQKRSKYGVPKK